MNPHNPRFYSELEQTSSYYYDESPKVIRSMPIGNERLAALRDLGVTFKEGTQRVTKIATPSGTPILPSFVDAGQIDNLLLQEQKKQQSRPKYYTESAGSFSFHEDYGRRGEWR
ncbi:hypothetical protein G6F46_006683 [Rhizopus delemar]|uniref:Uncharacterized protein n=3 Tax=Rhizopus TaxID=4842 RepID=I1CEN9_RHIO9|nr:hypothetical protein RO3G_11630 [Rhizopus delemar RA 99-880]KAG1054683.1 hypothetical protein G6F43_003309 [Rhizopus delemar]KAG1534715.1 hypothetical protein G6F51_011940 [Rhizopus arrhizus]KAG1497033.1 hypothetical protein G6F54_006053 [Rhizopus delemar]KAG1507173.1 hypothetical protein G6F53_009144 [Rhizopus delemar]|eukprot:EIE86919.1 hypothetical protein RO3G_11630 [Rhizopus delemar RA 99-880]